MMYDAHAPLAPSSAHIWAPENGCRGSVALQAAHPAPEDTPEAREGTAAHHYVAELLNGRDVAVGAVAPNGHPIDAEMVDCAQAILIDIRDTMRAAGPNAVLRVEQRVHALSVHEHNYGTPDAYLIDRTAKALHIWDYKYGHRFVDAVRNWQMIDYAIGVFDAEGLSPVTAFDHSLDHWNGWRVSLTIAQPRNYDPIGPMREWHTTGEVLRDTYLPRLRQSAFEAMQPGAALTTGDHCRDCSARHVCPALQRAGAIAMDVSLHAQPVVLTPHAVGLELRQIEDAIARLKARQTGLEEQALGMLRGGTRVPFFTASHASGRERWKVPAAEAFALGDMLGVDLRKPQEAVTPAQARKAGIDAAVIQAYAETPKGALRLSRVDDDSANLAFGD
jgi:hypothetical protein